MGSGTDTYDVTSGLRGRLSDAEPLKPYELASQLRALVWERLEGEAATSGKTRRGLFRRSSR